MCWLYWLHGGYGNQYIIDITYYHWYRPILEIIVLIILITRRLWKSIYHRYYILPLIRTDIRNNCVDYIIWHCTFPQITLWTTDVQFPCLWTDFKFFSSSLTWKFDGDSKSDIVLSLKWLTGPQKSNFFWYLELRYLWMSSSLFNDKSRRTIHIIEKLFVLKWTKYTKIKFSLKKIKNCPTKFYLASKLYFVGLFSLKLFFLIECNFLSKQFKF